MKLSHAFVKEAFERSALKLSVISLSILSLLFGVLLSLDLSPGAVVIDRACESTVLEIASSLQTKAEIENFIKIAVGLRFDSVLNRDPSAFLTQELTVVRFKEQEELSRGGIDQRLIVRSIRMEKDHYIIEADRLIAISKVRSAVPIILLVKISSKNRSVTNPYGLVVSSVDQLKEEKKNE